MTIKIGKKAIITTLVLAIFALAYNLIFFLIPWKIEKSNAAFWITYGFTWGAIILCGIFTGLAFNKKEVKSNIFGIPVFKVGVVMLLLQFVIDAVILGVGSFFEIWFWIPLIVEVLLFATCALLVISRLLNRQHIDVIDAKSVKESFIKELRIETETLCKNNTIDDLKQDLIKLNEEAKYSDPVSSKAVEDIEDQIADKMTTLKGLLDDANIEEAKKVIKTLIDLVEERKLRTKFR